MSYQSNKDDDAFEAIVIIIAVIIALIMLPISCYNEHKTEQKYGKEKYEIVILDKWEDIGSTYHLVGGRATETEYHIQYKYRCTNRPDNEYMSEWHVRDTDVTYPKYKEYKVGRRYISESEYIDTW